MERQLILPNATTTWTGTNTAMDEIARDAHWGAEKTWIITVLFMAEIV